MTTMNQHTQGSVPTDALSESRRSRAGELLAIALVTTGLRVLVAFISAAIMHQSVLAFASQNEEIGWGDAPSYTIQAKAMAGDITVHDITDPYHWRVFPGFPAMIAVVHKLGVPLNIAALVIPWISAGIAAAAAAALFNDMRIGWALSVLIPHYLTYSAMPMTEAPLLALLLCGLILACRGHPLIGGLLIGYGGLVRPVACFALAGYVLYAFWVNKRLAAILTSLAAGAVVAAGILLLHHWTGGNAFRGVNVYANHPGAYNGQLFTWPFHSLIATMFDPKLPYLKTGKIIYVWTHVIIMLSACGLLVWRFTHRKPQCDTGDILALPWVVLNTIFVLCVGSKWGFLAFHRFAIPALPGVFYAFRSWLPRKRWVWAVIAVPSLIIAVDSVRRMN